MRVTDEWLLVTSVTVNNDKWYCWPFVANYIAIQTRELYNQLTACVYRVSTESVHMDMWYKKFGKLVGILSDQ